MQYTVTIPALRFFHLFSSCPSTFSVIFNNPLTLCLPSISFPFLLLLCISVLSSVQFPIFLHHLCPQGLHQLCQGTLPISSLWLCLPSAQAPTKGLQSPSPPKSKASTATIHALYMLQLLGCILHACPQPAHPPCGIKAHTPPCPKPTQCPGAPFTAPLHLLILIPPHPRPHFIPSTPNAA